MKLTDRKLCNNKFTKSLLQEKQLCWKELTVSYHPTNQNRPINLRGVSTKLN